MMKKQIYIERYFVWTTEGRILKEQGNMWFYIREREDDDGDDDDDEDEDDEDDESIWNRTSAYLT